MNTRPAFQSWSTGGGGLYPGQPTLFQPLVSDHFLGAALDPFWVATGGGGVTSGVQAGGGVGWCQLNSNTVNQSIKSATALNLADLSNADGTLFYRVEFLCYGTGTQANRNLRIGVADDPFVPVTACYFVNISGTNLWHLKTSLQGGAVDDFTTAAHDDSSVHRFRIEMAIDAANVNVTMRGYVDGALVHTVTQTIGATTMFLFASNEHVAGTGGFFEIDSYDAGIYNRGANP